VLFGAHDQVSTVSVPAALPVSVWERGLAGSLLLRGFPPSRLLDGPPPVEPAVVPA
jgi:hypothetical protein